MVDTLSLLLSSKARAEILRLLYGLEQKELHVRELARRAGLSSPTVRQELGLLVRLDLVISRRDGNRLYYGAQPANPLYTVLRDLVLKTSGLVDHLRAALGTEGIKVAFVFGSLARGDQKASSDIDLVVIGDIGLREIARRLRAARDLGREINPYRLSPAEFARRRDVKEHFVDNVLKSEKLFVIGGEHELETMGR